MVNTKNKKLIFRLGMAAKGIVYCLIGALTFWGAFGVGTDDSGTKGSLQFLSDQPVGEIMLWIIALGLAAYVAWRLYQSIWDAEDLGTSLSGIGTRIGCLSSGVFYAMVLVSALQILLGFGSSGDGQELYIQILLNQEYGRWLVAAVAVTFLGNAIFQLYLAISGNYKIKVDAEKMDSKKRKLFKVTGIAGYTARSLLIGTIAYLTVRAALTYDAEEAGGSGDAFKFIQNQFGPIPLAIIATGLFAYGIFMLLRAKERELDFN